MAEKPQVWICTPLKRLDFNGVLDSERWEELRKLYPEYIKVLDVLRCVKDPPWKLEVRFAGGGSVFRARNHLVSEFMAETTEDEDQMLMLDVDLRPSPQNLVDLILNPMDIIGALYTVRAEYGHWVLNKYPMAAPTPYGLPVMELGTGCKRFKRRVFKKVLKDNPQRGRNDGHSWLDCVNERDRTKRELGFFSAGPVWDDKLWPGEGRILTEDYWFDWLTRSSGFVTYVDTKIKLYHRDDATGKIYPKEFPPDPAALPEETAAP